MSPHSRVLARAPALEISTREFADDVRYYLSLKPRQLPSRYLYDALGSALFEAICRLPWYGLTRGETTLLTDHAEEIFAASAPVARIIELGSGGGDKLITLLAGAGDRRGAVDLHLIDISKPALDTAARALSTFDDVRVITHQAPYEVGLEDVRNEPPAAGRALILFLGSNIGNFDPPGAGELLRQIRAAMASGDGLLLGADLVKPERDLLLAYDDPLGVTSAFNRNLLARLNRELGADIDLSAFAHRALWNPDAARIEMHLVCTRSTRVRVPAAQVDFVMDAGETIWTESSYKYRPDDLIAMLETAGFRRQLQFVDPESQFALTLVEVAD